MTTQSRNEIWCLDTAIGRTMIVQLFNPGTRLELTAFDCFRQNWHNNHSLHFSTYQNWQSALITKTKSMSFVEVSRGKILITCACFERELTIKVAIIGSCEHDTTFARNACKLCTQVCSSCERALNGQSSSSRLGERKFIVKSNNRVFLSIFAVKDISWTVVIVKAKEMPN